jgi:AraC family transcriptional regulator
MDTTILRAVERSIRVMRANLGEQLTTDDLARAAMFSKFHYSRIFQRTTGVSPGRFLSALRIEEAKRLLLSTSDTVADIGHRVGYNSIGTFSSRFSASVGLSPIAYRRRGGRATAVTDAEPGPSANTVVRGQVRGLPPGGSRPIFVGLFSGPVPEGRPVRHAVLTGAGPYVLPTVPPGTWHLAAHCTTAGQRWVGFAGAIGVRADLTACLADVDLRPIRLTDPPLLLALPAHAPAQPLPTAG